MTLAFLSGLPRSGSTVLAALLNQHPDIAATATSGLSEMMGAAVQQWEASPTTTANGRDVGEIYGILAGMAAAAVRRHGKPLLLDKSRAWPNPNIIRTMEAALGEKVRIIATVRATEDCAASFVRVAKPDDLHGFLNAHPLIDHLKGSYALLSQGYTEFPDRFHFVEYEDLLEHPIRVLRDMESFLGLAPGDYDLAAIDGSTVGEDDEAAWGVKGLHEISAVLGRRHDQTAAESLGARVHEFRQPAFWRGEGILDRELHDLDRSLAAALSGDQHRAWQILQSVLASEPDNPRARFNSGWHVMAQGDLVEGHRRLSAGRPLGVFGNPPVSGAPTWDGITPHTVLLTLEGGLGDQIHGVRYARNIAARGARVIVGCEPSLAHLFADMPDVTAIAARQAAGYVLHDSQVLAMDAPATLNLSWGEVDGAPYLARPAPATPGRIGVRWSGNPQFEHEQHRRFDPGPLFSILARYAAMGCEVVSLQRDDGADAAPAFMSRPSLETWRDTQREVAKCDLVISSCTSVAHLAGAMGVRTWIIVPRLPYYLWSLSGDRTPHYDSVRLFRQDRSGKWPFAQISRALEEWSHDLCAGGRERPAASVRRLHRQDESDV